MRCDRDLSTNVKSVAFLIAQQMLAHRSDVDGGRGDDASIASMCAACRVGVDARLRCDAW
jgi:hypothetical protein